MPRGDKSRSADKQSRKVEESETNDENHDVPAKKAAATRNKKAQIAAIKQ